MMNIKLHFDKNKLILFDCFGVFSSAVILPWFLDKFGEKGREIDAHYCYLADRGIITLYEYAKAICDEYSYNVDEVLEEWLNEGIIKTEFIDYIYELKDKGYVVCLASNASKGLVEEVFKRNDVPNDLFDHLFISCYMKEAKPDKEFYEMILHSFDQKFDEVYMIDDRDVNLVRAKELGIKTIVFTSLNELKKVFNSERE